MTTTLEKAGDTLTLPPDLLWTDEFAWSPISQSTERGLTGAYLIDIHQRTAGQPITLSGQENVAWLLRTEAQAIKAWASLPGQVFTLTHNGAAYSVMFDHGTEETSRAFSVTPVVDFSDPMDADHYCNLTLRFFTV